MILFSEMTRQLKNKQSVLNQETTDQILLNMETALWRERKLFNQLTVLNLEDMVLQRQGDQLQGARDFSDYNFQRLRSAAGIEFNPDLIVASSNQTETILDAKTRAVSEFYKQEQEKEMQNYFKDQIEKYEI